MAEISLDVIQIRVDGSLCVALTLELGYPQWNALGGRLQAWAHNRCYAYPLPLGKLTDDGNGHLLALR